MHLLLHNNYTIFWRISDVTQKSLGRRKKIVEMVWTGSTIVG
jgi:hypothetical protein